MFKLDGKTALVTGAGAGIGRATSLLLAGAGATVIATDRDTAALVRLAAELPSLRTTALDVTDPQAVERVVRDAGALDVLVNCAGVVPHGTILDGTRADWQRVFEINVTSTVDMIRAALPGMLERGKGNIINIASVVSTLKAAPNRCAYAASKAAVIALSKSVALDFIARGIRCNAICPGTIDTPSLEGRMAAQGDLDAARKSFIARQPMGRLGQADEIAATALYLAVDESAFMTGHALVIDGGFSL